MGRDFRPAPCPVPNVPCGVESVVAVARVILLSKVPNVPCGVERDLTIPNLTDANRVPNVPCGVERAEETHHAKHYHDVPNVPCGVESTNLKKKRKSLRKFLMYRVELKEALQYPA